MENRHCQEQRCESRRVPGRASCTQSEQEFEIAAMRARPSSKLLAVYILYICVYNDLDSNTVLVSAFSSYT